MPPQRNSSSSSSSSSKPNPKAPAEARPSSSVVLISPTNEVLLLHRVATGSSFPSAHVFPGGNLDPLHDGEIPAEGAAGRHADGPAYRMGAVRECFEESGILLAKKDGELVRLGAEERDAARRRVHAGEEKFGDFLEAVGATADTDALIPCTRWITPANLPKRFTTQMYLYLLPISRGSVPSEILIPTPDNGVEHTSAHFAPPQTFLSRAASKEITLFPPQVFLLHLLARFFNNNNNSSSSSSDKNAGTTPPLHSIEEGPLHYMAQRKKLLAYLRRVPTAETQQGRVQAASAIPWADKVMSPRNLFVRAGDSRVVLGLDWAGQELKGSERGGDWEQVVLVRFGKRGPTEVEVRRRQDVLDEEKATKARMEKL